MILVTGATGNVGRALVRELDAKGARFRVLVRDPARAAGLPASAERVTGDLSRPETLAPAFDGAGRLFLLVPGVGAEHAVNAVAAARAAGVGQVVLLSSALAGFDLMLAMGRWHREREEIVRGCGVPATVLRPGGFMTNALDWLPTIRQGRFVIDPVGPGRYCVIDPADIGAVAALTLTEDGHQAQEYVLTGDEAFTVAEQVKIISVAAGCDIEVRPAATPDEALRLRFPGGAPPVLTYAITEWFATMRADTVGFRTDTVARLLGRGPRTFADWCECHAGVFRRACAG
jgi:uncharacterized protein YbjT (DUF2867 family)